MKKLLILIILISLFACNTNKKEETIIEEIEIPQEEEIQEEETYMDLTFMTGTVIYAEVINILTNPSEYANKRIKIKGLFTTGKDNEDNLIFGCLIPDATACCAQGVQFVLVDDYRYPYDYPELGEDIIVEGDFYYEVHDDYTLIRLDNAILTN